MLFFIGLILTTAFGFWWFEPSHISHNFSGILHVFDYLLFVLLTYIVWHQIIMELFCWYVARCIRTPKVYSFPQPNLRVAYITAFVPGAEPYSILERTLQAMINVEYSHDTWILDEGNDSVVQKMCTRLHARHYSRKDRTEFNTDTGKFTKKTKGGNYNSWFHQHGHEYDIIAQHDVDFIPKENFLVRTLGYFRDPEVAFVGGPQVYGNTKASWIARGSAEQTYGFYGSMQKGFDGHDMTLLIGANHLIRASAFVDIDGYTAHIAEDMLTGMKFYAKKWKSVYVPETLLVGEGPSTWPAYFGQQMRWAYGCMDIVFRHSGKLLPKMHTKHTINYLVLQQFYFLGIAQAVGIVLLTMYFLFGITSASMNFLPIVILYIPLLLYQVFFGLWLQRFNIDPKKEKGLFLRGKLLFIAVWPIFLLAFVGVVRNKRLTYVVTPKGTEQKNSACPELFIIHLVLGSITFLGMIVGYVTGHTAPQMLFWAILNTVFMFGFFFTQFISSTISKYKGKGLRSLTLSPLFQKVPLPATRTLVTHDVAT